MKGKLKSEKIILVFIVFIGSFLRLYNLNEMPFMHDEFSALFRTRFESFWDVLDIGVRIGDTHPPGVQVFLWLYVQLVGENELFLKLPFVFMGIISIPLTYSIGKEWFNKNVGLIVAAFIATAQYPLTYSVIVRPYISGLFLVLFMVYFWTFIIKERTTLFHYIGYIFFSVLSAYNHHFSLLFAFVVGVTGVFVVSKKKLIKYVVSGVLIMLLYLPNLAILLFQLNKGGLDGWLRETSVLFPLNYVKYVFHFSIWVYILVVFIFITSLIYSWNKKWTIFYKIAVLWFLIPITIGMLYSIYRNPILQHSMLIFSFPFFLFSLFGLFPENISKRFVKVIVLTILIVNVYTLVLHREHYRVLYETRHLEFLKDIDLLEEKENSTILISNHVEINQFYQKKYLWDFEYKNYFVGVSGKLGLDKVQTMVSLSDNPYFIYGGLSYSDPEIVQIIKEKYPYCTSKKDYYASNLYVFSKKETCDTLKPYFLEVNNFTKPKKYWLNVDLKYENKIAFLDSSREWGPSFEFNLDTVLVHRNDVIDVSVEVVPELSKELDLVTVLKYEDSIINYDLTSSSNFNLEKGKTKHIYKTLELSGLSLPSKNVTILTYLWNRTKGNFVLKNFKISVRRGNPIQYSLYEPILENYE